MECCGKYFICVLISTLVGFELHEYAMGCVEECSMTELSDKYKVLYKKKKYRRTVVKTEDFKFTSSTVNLSLSHLVGSSKNMTGGLLTSSRAMASRLH